MTDIELEAFEGCTGLTNIHVSESLTEIGCKVFHGCTGLTSIHIPESVTSIGKGAFYDCVNLVIKKIPACVEDILSTGFVDCIITDENDQQRLIELLLPMLIDKVFCKHDISAVKEALIRSLGENKWMEIYTSVLAQRKMWEMMQVSINSTLDSLFEGTSLSYKTEEADGHCIKYKLYGRNKKLVNSIVVNPKDAEAPSIVISLAESLVVKNEKSKPKKTEL